MGLRGSPVAVPTPSSSEAAWGLALDLSERREALAHLEPAARHGAPAFPRRSPRPWRGEPPLEDERVFRLRLAAEALTEEALAEILAQPVEALWAAFSEMPDWAASLSRILDSADGELQDVPWRDPQFDRVASSMLMIAAPFIRDGLRRLRRRITALSAGDGGALLDASSLPALLCSMLPSQLAPRLNRIIALEVNLARVRGSLVGATPEARYDDFVRQLCRRDRLRELLETYPVLARHLVSVIDDWERFASEFLGHLVADWPDISMTLLLPRHPGRLSVIDSELGDQHRGGRRVVALGFESGMRLVYKPRSLDVDLHFQSLLEWVDRHAGGPGFRKMRVLPRGDHGWCEWISHEPCSTRAEIERFYTRQGGYLAILHALGATDFHSENVVAHGEHPVLVDLESVFQPRLGVGEAATFEDPASLALESSVMSTGLLPNRVDDAKAARGVDVSGLGGRGGQPSPVPISRWEGVATDRMRMIDRHVELEGSLNRPVLAGSEVEIADHRAAVRSGFERVYRALMTNRDEVLASLLGTFARDEIRVIPRATKVYNELLRPSFHPDLARNALDRDLFLSCLWRVVPDLPHLGRLAPAELGDVRAGDIPIFTASAGAETLRTSRGGTVTGVVKRSGIEEAAQRIASMGNSDLERQLWLVDASFATLEVGTGRATWPHWQPPSKTSPASPARLVAAARAIGDRLDTLAHRRGDAVNWLGVTPAAGEGWSLAPSDAGLYSGVSGLALFLGYLGTETGEERFDKLARGALETFRHQLKAFERWSRAPDPGAFSGVAGGVHAMAHLGTLWNDAALLEEAEALGALLPALVEEDGCPDFLCGAAGCVATLLALHAARPSRTTLASAVSCGDAILARAVRAGAGLGWPVPSAGEIPLAGFAHGAAGIAYALLALTGASGAERFRTAALDGIAYERSLFERHGFWPDLRRVATEYGDERLCAWCHGASGIGLARLGALSECQDPATRDEIAHAVERTLREGFGLNHSLCHGDLGNLELLLQASETVDGLSAREIDSLAATVLADLEGNGCRTGLPLGIEAPGLMTGLAGIGYGLLRLAAPERVPSVLLLERPRVQAAR